MGLKLHQDQVKFRLNQVKLGQIPHNSSHGVSRRHISEYGMYRIEAFKACRPRNGVSGTECAGDIRPTSLLLERVVAQWLVSQTHNLRILGLNSSHCYLTSRQPWERCFTLYFLTSPRCDSYLG